LLFTPKGKIPIDAAGGALGGGQNRGAEEGRLGDNEVDVVGVVNGPQIVVLTHPRVDEQVPHAPLQALDACQLALLKGGIEHRVEEAVIWGLAQRQIGGTGLLDLGTKTLAGVPEYVVALGDEPVNDRQHRVDVPVRREVRKEEARHTQA
jgi:hypothetical protein